MNEERLLRATAVSMRKGDFDPVYTRGPGCGCFVYHLDEAAKKNRVSDRLWFEARSRVFSLISSDSWPAFSSTKLRQEGWTKDDAVALLEIAADLAAV